MVQHTVQGDKESCCMIHIQRPFRENARDVELILSTLCFTVESIERDIDGKLFSIIERTAMCIWSPSNSSDRIMAVNH